MGRFLRDSQRSVTPEMVIEVLGRHGQEISLERAAGIVELLYELSGHSVALEIRLATEQAQASMQKKPNRKPKITTNENCRPIRKGKYG